MMALPETKTLAETQLTAVTYTAGENGDGALNFLRHVLVAVLPGDAAVLCGFGSPTARIDLEYQDAAGATQTLRYTIGGTVPAGDGRCLRLGDDRTIFAVTAESAAAVLALGDLAA